VEGGAVRAVEVFSAAVLLVHVVEDVVPLRHVNNLARKVFPVDEGGLTCP
jgi:hypothetical protein